MEETTRILEELFDKGYATREISLIGDKLKAIVRSLAVKDQLEIEKSMGKDKTSPAAFIIHSYSLKLLSKTLVSYGTTTFEEVGKVTEFLENLTNAIVDKLVKTQNALEKDIRAALELDKVEENFSETGPSPEKSEQQPE
jgi:hypothetical protein